MQPAPRRLSLALASPLALALGCAVELSTADAWLAPRLLGLLGLLVVAVGTVQGAAWDLAFALLAPWRLLLRAGAWIAFAFALAALLAWNLGAFARLFGPYHSLAVMILAACGLGAPLLAAALLGLQPSPRSPLGWFAARPPLQRATWALALLCGAAACFAADARLFVGLYPGAHAALRFGALWLASFSLVVVLRRPRRLPRMRYLFALPLLCAVAAVVLGERAGVRVGTIGLRPWPRMALEGARQLTDFDLDGYSAWLAGGDCAPWSSGIHPGAAEIPGNGIDENCLLGDAKHAATATDVAPMPASAPPMDVVLITVDSLRPDHVGAYAPAYGASGFATTPQLDAFARNALVFERAYTAGGWTSISVAAMMRGVYPRRVAWTRVYETNQFRLVRWAERRKLMPGEWLTKMFPLPVTDKRPTLAAVLHRREMRTVAVVDDEFSELLSPASAVANGFRRYIEVDRLPPERRSDAGTAELAIREIARIPAGQRFFLWVHFFGPHSPNREHPGIRLDGPALVQGYDHEIRYTDLQLGRLLRVLEARDQPTAVFVSADHGEDFVGEERHHGFSLNEAVARVPLIARVPGWERGRSLLPVSLVDLMPTILALTNTPAPTDLDGRPIQELLQRTVGSGQLHRVLLADTWQYDRQGRLVRGASAAFDGRRTATFEPMRNTWLLKEPDDGEGEGRPVSPKAGSALVRALSGYIESTGGTPRLHY